MKNVTLTIQLPQRLPWLARLAWAFRKKRSRRRLPESWQEASPAQRGKLLALHLRRAALSAEAFQVLLLKHLLRLPNWMLLALHPIDLAEKLLPLARWAAEARIEKPFEPSVRLAGKAWRIPAPMAKDMPLGQYLACEQRFAEIFASPAPSAAPFLAALLRPEGEALRAHLYATGLLPPASEYEMEAHSELLASAPQPMVFYLVQYYATQRLLLREKYPNLHRSKEGEGPAGLPDWDSIAPRIAEAGAFGSLEQVLRTPTVSYLAWANAKAEPEKQPSLQDMIRQNHSKFMN